MKISPILIFKKPQSWDRDRTNTNYGGLHHHQLFGPLSGGNNVGRQNLELEKKNKIISTNQKKNETKKHYLKHQWRKKNWLKNLSD